MEMAYRLFAVSRRMPKDVYKWWAKNKRRIDFIIEAVRKWPEKQEGGDELFILGSFRVHNTVGATGSELASLKKTIEMAEKLVRKNSVPGFRRVLYGDIQVVSRITQAHHAAWYHPADDSLYLRRGKKTGMDEVQSLVHELGHRYWDKFALKDTKSQWRQHHWRVENQDVDVDLPGVGETIPVRVKGVKGDPIVKKMEGGHYWFEVPVGKKVRTLSIPIYRIQKILADNEKRVKNFPTPYASKNEEEHFCESLKMLAAGVLPDEHAIPFKVIWI
jgi:hypothetical protein